ncbi:NADH-quinone oxidoreductase subunit L [Fulvivirga lutea]|uniref:NADH-quinone oxidoreductase subunit L n=1 Tax=Fulvivirga lutea TaxID=2810512 RepID=A0A974ZZC9_9BACT|nr:NADH-quinone oxidoreductase subunit L [Fulvivirga lutea]QSE95946.1 NADH-quinone oxidoreductase subunit L [Fulvivirga lutea]
MISDWDFNGYWLLILLALPLLSIIVNVGVFKANRSPLISVVLLFTSTVISLILLSASWGNPLKYHLDWFSIGSTSYTLTFFIDRITGLMLFIVTFISALVHWFSIDYMKEDAGRNRYFALLGLFTFSMLGILISSNLLIIFMFWELVGLSSYLLIGFWFTKESAAKASKKAFIVNRIGDIGFVIGLALAWFNFHSFDLLIIQESLGSISLLSPGLVSICGFMFFLGAMGKSAQFPLQVWLPDAMEGPTPVSALIHAATMVAAGVYLMIRVSFLLSADVLIIVAVIGAITAFMGAYASLFQNDIKKVLAFSTISQLGYMIIGVGVSTPDAAFFHLLTHAFFKAGLFLGAGAIIYAIHKAYTNETLDAQDMRNMGGLKSAMPITFAAFLVFSLALIGIPFTSGFLSKEAVLLGAIHSATTQGGMYWLIVILGFVSVALTSYYVIRMLALVFFGSHRASNQNAIKESSLTFKIVLIVLAIGSVGFVWSFNPFSVEGSWVLSSINLRNFNSSELPHLLTSTVSLACILIGASIAWYGYRKGNLTSNSQSIPRNISLNNWYLDDIYQLLLIKPFTSFAQILKRLEHKIIDRIVNLIGIGTAVLSHVIGWLDRHVVDGFVSASVYVVGRTGLITKSVQGGKVQSYILLAILGLIIIIFLAI